MDASGLAELHVIDWQIVMDLHEAGRRQAGELHGGATMAARHGPSMRVKGFGFCFVSRDHEWMLN